MRDAIKAAVNTARSAVRAAFNKVRSTEPVVAIGAVVGVVAAVQQFAASELEPGDGWAAAGWAFVVWLVRTQVSPAKP